MLFVIRNCVSCVSCVNGFSLRFGAPLVTITQKRDYAARKGTREKARKKKVKVEEKKVEFIPHNQRGLEKLLMSRPKKKFDDSWKQIATDNVYPMKYYKWKVYSFAEAVQCHRETHDPSMYNLPDAELTVQLELDLNAEKKGRFVDSIRGVAAVAHPFPLAEERQVLAFCRDVKQQERLRGIGAAIAGGSELIKAIQTGEVTLSDFQFVLAHPDMLAELVALRGLLRRRFPNPKNNTLTVDLEKAVHRYVHGVTYISSSEEHEPELGFINAPIGLLSFPTEHLEENLKALLCEVEGAKPRRPGPFITRCLLTCFPSTEKLKIDHVAYVSQSKNKEKVVEDEDDNEENVQKVATA